MKKKLIWRALLMSAVLLNILLLPLNLTVSLGTAAADAAGSSTIDAWWPTSGSHMDGVQPFKALLEGTDPSQYQMYWQVDGGQLNAMSENDTGGAHMEASVDVSGWTWRGSGPYTVNFVAQQNGQTIAQQSEEIYVDNGLPTEAAYQPTSPVSDTSQSTSTQSSADPTTQTSSTSNDPSTTTSTSASASDPASPPSTLVVQETSDPSNQATIDVSSWNISSPNQVSMTLENSTPTPAVQATTLNLNQTSGFYVDPNSDAAEQAEQWATSDPTDAALMNVLAAQPTAEWFGDWNSDIESAVQNYVDTTAQAGKTAVLVAYNIPDRDCGGYSQGGAENETDYINWIGGFARGIGNNPAIVILEPDALAGLDCLAPADQAAREQMLSSAVSILKTNTNTKVYLDAGNPTWQSPQTMATRLKAANIDIADGFSLNVSNFQTTADNVSYGEQISALVGDKHFVIDTSRNGSGSNGQWCNPSNATAGDDPTTNTGNSLVDAFLWVKVPGESDGTCNGGPAAGVWWPQYAIQLAK